MATKHEQELRMKALEMSLRVPDRQQYAGMATLQQGYSTGRTADTIIADAHKILAFISPPVITTTKCRKSR